MPPEVFSAQLGQCIRCNEPVVKRAGRGWSHINSRGHEAAPWNEEFKTIDVREIAGDKKKYGMFSNSAWKHVRIYVVRCGPFHKIGYTAGTVQKRIENMMGANPYDLEIVLDFPGLKYMEGDLHRAFQDKKHRFEWFNLEPEDIQWIRENYVTERTP